MRSIGSAGSRGRRATPGHLRARRESSLRRQPPGRSPRRAGRRVRRSTLRGRGPRARRHTAGTRPAQSGPSGRPNADPTASPAVPRSLDNRPECLISPSTDGGRSRRLSISDATTGRHRSRKRSPRGRNPALRCRPEPNLPAVDRDGAPVIEDGLVPAFDLAEGHLPRTIQAQARERGVQQARQAEVDGAVFRLGALAACPGASVGPDNGSVATRVGTGTPADPANAPYRPGRTAAVRD